MCSRLRVLDVGSSRQGLDTGRASRRGSSVKSWRTATALGVVSVYVLALLGPTYYARRTLGWQRWRIAHRFIAAGLALAILHVTLAG
jgi:predicted ferric reductase